VSILNCPDRGFLDKSRDQWKEKCSEAKAKVKQLNNRVRFLENSKKRLKNKNKALEAELAQVKAQERLKEIEKETQKKSLLKEQ
jgi:uncharacterized protein YlxW (UPF0749 family)